MDTGGRRPPTKLSFSRLELPVRTFVKVLDIDLDRIIRHITNIHKLAHAEDWAGLHREQVNTTRTVQQIKANIQEMDRIRNQVTQEDLDTFVVRVRSVLPKVASVLGQLLGLVGDTTGQMSPLQYLNTDQNPHKNMSSSNKTPRLQQRSYSESSQPDTVVSPTSGHCPHTPVWSFTSHVVSGATPREQICPSRAAIDAERVSSWELMKESILDLKGECQRFFVEIQAQLPGHVNNLNTEDRVRTIVEPDDSCTEVTQDSSKQQIKGPSRYQAAALLPVVGAVVGGVVAGPVGLVAGVKLGSLFGAAGAVGFAGAKLVQAHQEKISESKNKMPDATDSTLITDTQPLSPLDSPVGDDEEEADPSPEQTDTRTQETQPVQPKRSDLSSEVAEIFTTVTSSFRKFFSFSDVKNQGTPDNQ